jgi:DNA polymerase III alpha subunit
MERMAFCEAEDASGKAELIIFPKTFATCETYFNEGKNIFIVRGEIDGTNPEQRKIKAESIFPAQNYLEMNDSIAKIVITIPEPVSEYHCLAINDHLTPGTAEIILQYPEDGKFFAVKLAEKMKISNDSLNKLTEMGISFQLETNLVQKVDLNKNFWKKKNNFQPR